MTQTHEIKHPHLRGRLDLEVQLTTDRAGNALGHLIVTLDEGTLLNFVSPAPGEPHTREVLSGPVHIPIRFDPYALASLAVRACTRKGRRAKVWPLLAVAPRQLPTKRVPR